MSCGIGTVMIEAQETYSRIVTTGTSLPDGIKNLRITPGVYITLYELDAFVEAVKAIAAQGIVRQARLLRPAFLLN